MVQTTNAWQTNPRIALWRQKVGETVGPLQALDAGLAAAALFGWVAFVFQLRRARRLKKSISPAEHSPEICHDHNRQQPYNSAQVRAFYIL